MVILITTRIQQTPCKRNLNKHVNIISQNETYSSILCLDCEMFENEPRLYAHYKTMHSNKTSDK